MITRSGIISRAVRRLPVVLACLLLAVASATLVERSRPQPTTSWSASALLVVPPNKDPGRQARNYTVQLRDDTAVLDAVGSALRRDRASVRSGLALQEVSGTSLVRVQFRDRRPGAAVAGLHAFVLAVTASPPLSQAIAPGSLVVVSEDDEAVAMVARSRSVLPAAVALGLLLGIVVAMALDRGDARVDREGDLLRLGKPATDVELSGGASLAAVLLRWEALLPHNGHVALLAPDGSDRGAERRASRLILYAAQQAGQAVDVLPDEGIGRTTTLRHGTGRRGEPVTGLALLPGRLGQQQRGSLLALESDAVVLVVARGTPVRLVERAVAELAALGLQPMWYLIVSAGRIRLLPIRSRVQDEPEAWSRTG